MALTVNKLRLDEVDLRRLKELVRYLNFNENLDLNFSQLARMAMRIGLTALEKGEVELPRG